ncbi:hypothetical protein CEY12_12045 [Chryseobacterium sp. T16E-39]|uniref:PKD domain-containing protein n=1 Tax=Chryseobacterium sp. T16E-39 TaxID=2015076 RepID=UPI000B5B3A43|nr:PKD domain-containing protein [Chryseobacterium sp. T16E-39]ASK30799.1 hypothetical protein CEY12_12045 [Chryseobacterium sp. T16E-39]
MRLKLLIIFILLLKASVYSQNTNNFWYFGNQAGIYFDNLGAHAATGNLLASEGVASISDGCGLLFYTDGDIIWNANHQIMVNGSGIGGKCSAFSKSSSSQSALIVRQPASNSIFYVFTTDCTEDNLVDGLRYSVVDTSMNNGLGQVVLKNQPLLGLAEEKITAAKHSNGCDIWIISHKYTTNEFYSYLITGSGINTTPVISSTGQIHDSLNPNYINARGYLKASPNGQMLINVNPDGAYSWAVTTLPELFNFDKLTGNVSSNFVFPADTQHWWGPYTSWTIPFYGATFSPDNSKLYLSSGFYGPNLYQFNLNAGTTTDIVASKTLLSPFPFAQVPENIPVSLVNAPDGKIYVAQRWKGYLGTINNPNALGAACNYNESSFNLAPGTENDWGGLPNFFEDYINPKSLSANFAFLQATTNSSVQFTDNSVDATGYYWNFGDGGTSTLQNPVHTYANTGYYNVSLSISGTSCDVDKICKTVYVEPKLGVNETGNVVNFDISPNPFTNEITINIAPTKDLMLELYTAVGDKLKTIDISNKKQSVIQLRELTPGVYFIQLRSKEFTIRKKIIKQ